MSTKTITLTSNRDRASTTVRVTLTHGSKGYENMRLGTQALRNAETRAGLVDGDFFCLPLNLVVYDRNGTSDAWITLTSNRDRASTTVRVTLTRGSKGCEIISLSAQALLNAEKRAGLVDGDFFCLPSNLVVYDRHGTPVAC